MSDLALDILSKKYKELEEELNALKKRKSIQIRPLYDLPFIGSVNWDKDSVALIGLFRTEFSHHHLNWAAVDTARIWGNQMIINKSGNPNYQDYETLSKDAVSLMRTYSLNPQYIYSLCYNEEFEWAVKLCRTYRGWIDLERLAGVALRKEFDRDVEKEEKTNDSRNSKSID